MRADYVIILIGTLISLALRSCGPDSQTIQAPSLNVGHIYCAVGAVDVLDRPGGNLVVTLNEQHAVKVLDQDGANISVEFIGPQNALSGGWLTADQIGECTSKP